MLAARAGVGWTILGLAVLAGPASCRRILPDDPDDTARPDTDPPVESDEDTGGPVPRCAVDEAEPNEGPQEATALPLETRGCGTIGGAGDRDVWSTELAEESWIDVRVDAQTLGSRADVLATLAGGQDGLGLTVVDGLDHTDARMVVPASVGAYTITVLPDGPQAGGEDAFYEIRASITKPPVDADVAEAANDDPDDPQALSVPVGHPEGLVVVGGWSGLTDEDHYAVSVPAGGHRLTVDVEAAVHASPSDPVLIVTIDGVQITVSDSDFGASPDPSWTQTFSAATEVGLTVRAEDGRTGPGHWYALRVRMESSL